MVSKEYPRSYRVGDQIQRELADLIHREVKDPRVDPLLTVAAVELSRDLSLARVYIGVLSEHGGETITALNHATGFLRGQLGKLLRLRKTPQLRFILDERAQQSERLSVLLQQARRKDQLS